MRVRQLVLKHLALSGRSEEVLAVTKARPQNAKGVKVAVWSELPDRQPAYALVADVDLVVVRYDDRVSVLYGRCLHRGALMSDGSIVGDNLICGLHAWDYRFDTGVSEYNNDEAAGGSTPRMR